MPKDVAEKYTLDYFILQCQSSRGLVGLALMGTTRLEENVNVLLFISSVPRAIPGLDEFGMQMASALPEAIQRDVREISEKQLGPAETLTELAKRYRGTIFATQRASATITLPPSVAHEPKKVVPKIIEKTMKLATEKLDDLRSQEPVAKRRRRLGKFNKIAIRRSHRRIRKDFNFPEVHVVRA